MVVEWIAISVTTNHILGASTNERLKYKPMDRFSLARSVNANICDRIARRSYVRSENVGKLCVQAGCATPLDRDDSSVVSYEIA